MDRRQLIIVGGIVVLGLLLAFPLSWIFNEPSGRTGPGSTVGVNSRSSVRQTDEDGTEWVLTQIGGPTVPKDANGVQANPVVVVRTDVFQVGHRQVSIGLVLTGPEGQRYSPVVVKAGVSRAAPRLRIVDEAGKVVLDDSFRYG